MAILGTIRKGSIGPYQAALDIKLERGVSLYAIAFDMDIEALETHYGSPYNNAYGEIKKILVAHGFTRQQGSVYFGNENINAVTCVLTAINLARSLPWFALFRKGYPDALDRRTQ